MISTMAEGEKRPLAKFDLFESAAQVRRLIAEEKSTHPEHLQRDICEAIIMLFTTAANDLKPKDLVGMLSVLYVAADPTTEEIRKIHRHGYLPYAYFSLLDEHIFVAKQPDTSPEDADRLKWATQTLEDLFTFWLNISRIDQQYFLSEEFLIQTLERFQQNQRPELDVMTARMQAVITLFEKLIDKHVGLTLPIVHDDGENTCPDECVRIDEADLCNAVALQILYIVSNLEIIKPDWDTDSGNRSHKSLTTSEGTFNKSSFLQSFYRMFTKLLMHNPLILPYDRQEAYLFIAVKHDDLAQFLVAYLQVTSHGEWQAVTKEMRDAENSPALAYIEWETGPPDGADFRRLHELCAIRTLKSLSRLSVHVHLRQSGRLKKRILGALPLPPVLRDYVCTIVP